MSKPQTSPAVPSPSLSLREQARQHELALLDKAEASKYPEIRKYALSSAAVARNEVRRHDAKISPRTALLFCLVVWGGFLAVCRYSVIHLPWQQATAVSFIAFVACGVVTLVCLTVSKHIDGDNVLSSSRTIPSGLASRISSADGTVSNSSSVSVYSLEFFFF